MTQDEEKIEHTGWDRGDYDVDDIGGFSGVRPGNGVDWLEELDAARDEIERLKRKKEREELQGHENDRLNWLRERADKIERWLDER